MTSKTYKCCLVPLCTNTTIKTPDKLFIHVPLDKKMRKMWLKLARRDPTNLSIKSTLYFCEDHFDLPNDMENFIRYHVMGSVSQVRMKPGCVPTKFYCQPDRRKRTKSTTRPYILKKQKAVLVKECLDKDQSSSGLGNNIEDGNSSASATTAACRICLAMEVPLFLITGSLQTVFEKLTSAELQTPEERPITCCHVCCAQLRKCRRLMLTSARAENVLSGILRQNTKITIHSISQIDREANGLSWPLKSFKTECFDNLPATIDIKTEIDSDHDNNELESFFEIETDDAKIDAATKDAETVKTDLEPDDTPEVEIVGVTESEEINKNVSQSENVSELQLKNIKTELEEFIIIREPIIDVAVKIEEIDEDAVATLEAEEEVDSIINENPAHTLGKGDTSNTLDATADSFIKTDRRKIIKTTIVNVDPGKASKSTKDHELGIDTANIEPGQTSKYDKAKEIEQTQTKNQKADTSPTKNNRREHRHTTHEESNVQVQTDKQTDPVIKVPVFKARYSKIEIEKNQQSGEGPHQCSVCQKRFTKRTNMNRHMKTHMGSIAHTCEICQKTFSRKFNLLNHLRIHNGEKPFECTVCHRFFRRKQELRIHSRIHTEEKRYKCEFCPYQCHTKCDLKKHVQGHTGEKPHKCTNCGLRFKRQTDLTRHSLTHTGEKPYQCDLCHQRFRRKQSVLDHLLVHAGEKPYQCNKCDYKSATKSVLTKHLKIHLGEKPYECDICHQRFSCRQNIVDHLKIHADLRPYHCDVCGYRAVNKSVLRKHLWRHSGVKPYQCSVCLCRFVFKSGLYRHEKIHKKLIGN